MKASSSRGRGPSSASPGSIPIVFDKTGTLTSGTPHVTRVVSYDRALDDAELIRLSAAAEHGFAIRSPAPSPDSRVSVGIVVPAVTVDPVGSSGSASTSASKTGACSSGAASSWSSISRLERSRSDETAAHAVGASPIFVAIDDHLAGMLELQDQLRDDAPEAVRALRARKMKNVIMLSGDHPEPTRVIAKSLGLRHHYAELLPEDKARLVRELKAEGRVVAMVGDGVNDALALQAADVGMAVPGGRRGGRRGRRHRPARPEGSIGLCAPSIWRARALSRCVRPSASPRVPIWAWWGSRHSDGPDRSRASF